MLDKLLQYLLPTLYKDDPQANIILEAAKDSTNRFKVIVDEAVNQLCAGLATWALEEWEKDLGITPPEGATTELRRALVKAKLMRPPIMTPAQIQAIANCFVPEKNAQVAKGIEPYTFRIILPGSVPWIREMMQSVADAKPSHLAMVAQMERDAEFGISLGYVSMNGGLRTTKLAPPDLTPTMNQQNVGFLGSLQGLGKVLISMPKSANSLNKMALAVSLGGFRRITCNPDDLPKSDKISAAMGWPFGIALQKSGITNIDIHRPQDQEMQYIAGIVTVRRGNKLIRSAYPSQADDVKTIAVVVAKGGFRCISYDPADLPKYEGITVHMGWPFGIALQKLGVLDVHIVPPETHEIEQNTKWGSVLAKGGYRRISYDPADLPKHERISERYLHMQAGVLIQDSRSITIPIKRIEVLKETESMGVIVARRGVIHIHTSLPATVIELYISGAVGKGGRKIIGGKEDGTI